MTSVSAGFVRVDPKMSLAELRGEISRQLDSTTLPESYVFLRCVGRDLCTVSRNQELSLSSQLFVPPLAACPEIYLLNASLTEGGPGSLSNSPLADLHSTHHCSPQLLTSSQFSNTHLAPLTLPAPLSPHTTSDDGNILFQRIEQLGGDDWRSPPTVLGHAAPTSTGLHFPGNYGSHPQGSADNYTHHHEAGLGGQHQTVKGRNVHFGGVTSYGGGTPSPTSTPDTTTVGLESLALSSPTQQSDPYSLLAHIRKVKQERSGSKVVVHRCCITANTSPSSTIRQLQHKLQARKEKDNSEWKQKLENEKKRTRKIEKSLRKLRTEIEAVDHHVTTSKKKPVEKSSASAEQRKTSTSLPKTDSDHTNVKLECKRADLDLEQLRKTRDEERQKLKVEQEKHQSIVEECRGLKKELNRLKVAQNKLQRR